MEDNPLITTNITTTPLTDMPVVDSPLDPEVADGLGDEMLLSTAAATKTQKVPAAGRWTGTNQSAQSRAWTSSGSVD